MELLKNAVKQQKNEYYAMWGYSVLIAGSIIAQAFLIVSIVEAVFLNSASFSSVLQPLGWLLAVMLVRVLTNDLLGRTGMRVAAKAKKGFRQSLLSTYLRKPAYAAESSVTGKEISVMMDAVDETDAYFSQYVPQRIATSAISVIVLCSIFAVNWVSGLLVLLTAPFIPVFMIIIGKNTQKKSEEQLEKLSNFSGSFLDILQGLKTIMLYKKTEEKKEDLRSSSLHYRDSTMEVLKVAFLTTLMLEFVSMLSIATVALEVGLRLVIYENITFFSAFFVLILVPEFYAVLKQLGSSFHNGRSSLGAAGKIEEVLQKEGAAEIWGSSELDASRPPLITLNGISYSYNGKEQAVRDVSASINPASKVAIVGRSGAGKSTLLHLLSGLISPQEGSILINGKHQKEYSEESWFNAVGYLSQDPYLFSGTLKDNIALGMKGRASDADIELAAVKAGLQELIAELPNGLSTSVGEAGRGLSGGEKQRLALARILLKKPAVILFDEPTTGLDLKTEEILQKSIAELAASSTIITVAHRLHTIIDADEILLLDESKLVAAGTHEMLTANVPQYAKMVELRRGGVPG
ncbi:thiol reductant ABC exporter subunit CydD [Bacillus lacus]|uniref:Thiol reductant ABC exporter subunit CydD n=1 Tax=Metabacillus lacus TaxID=1983721 RepID=A0A7X2J0Z5_9BACI|nr:thiol reductant ABC exporter subunit CydD [Metabacillus lacus]MRX73441.1 thiol reductant ABC exporter subunit CydD [Metabacillus lacus]